MTSSDKYVIALENELSSLKNKTNSSSGTSYTEIAWDIMTDVIEWNHPDFVDEYSTSGDQTYRDYYELYRFLYEHEKSVMEKPCEHDNQPSVCGDYEEDKE